MSLLKNLQSGLDETRRHAQINFSPRGSAGAYFYRYVSAIGGHNAADCVLAARERKPKKFAIGEHKPTILEDALRANAYRY